MIICTSRVLLPTNQTSMRFKQNKDKLLGRKVLGFTWDSSVSMLADPRKLCYCDENDVTAKREGGLGDLEDKIIYRLD